MLEECALISKVYSYILFNSARIKTATCRTCGFTIPLSDIVNHSSRCQQKNDLLEIIEDADRIFLKIDCSATSHIRNLMNGGTQSNSIKIINRGSMEILDEKPKNEDKKLSDKLRKIMNGISIIRSLIVGMNTQMQRQNSFKSPNLGKDPQNIFRRNSKKAIDNAIAERIKIIEKIKHISRKAFAIRLNLKNKSEGKGIINIRK